MNKKKLTSSEKYSLSELPFFSEFTDEDSKKISGFSSIRKYKKHQIIFLEGDDYSGFYIALKGKIKVFKTTSEGLETIIHLVKPFEIFAEVPLFEQTDKYPVNAEALEESELYFIPKFEFMRFVEEHPHIYFKIISGFAKKLRELTMRLESITLHEVTSRLANYILIELETASAPKKTPLSIELPISKASLAIYLGTITETLSRTFKKLQNEGILEVEGKKIIILDLKRLKILAK